MQARYFVIPDSRLGTLETDTCYAMYNFFWKIQNYSLSARRRPDWSKTGLLPGSLVP